MKKVFITGISGSGKSTIATELARRGFVVFDIDKVMGSCNWYDSNGKVADYHPGVGKKWLSKHQWICDFDQIKDMVKKLKRDEVFIVGITDNQSNFIDYFDQIFLLQISNNDLLNRLKKRTSNDFAQNAEEQEYLLETKEDFEQKMLGNGAISLNASLSISDITNKILSKLN